MITGIAPEMRGKLEPGRRRAYVLAGNATVTIRSTASGDRFTYQVRKSDPDAYGRSVWFVALLGGPDNEADWRYLGTIFANGFRVTRKSCAGPDAPSVVAFTWWANGHFEDGRVEVWHEGTCGRCGRRLTVPESIEAGLGPTCAEK